MTHAALHTALCDLVGTRYPIVQTGMGWVAGPRLTAATSNAGALGVLASATMPYDEVVTAIAEVKGATSEPFAVNLRADAPDAAKRCDLLIETGVKVASFAQAPKQDLIDRLHAGGVLVIPSIGAKRHAEKVLDWGVDAVLVQGGEGGGHTGAVPTSLLVPQVVDAVAGRVPVIAAGGYFDGRGLVSALAYGASGIAMGTRFLLTSDSNVPDAVKQVYLQSPVTGTVVSKKVDGVPHRVLRTPFVEKLESASPFTSLPRAVANAARFRKIGGMRWRDMLREGLAMHKNSDLGWAGVLQAANTPMLLRAVMIDGNVDAGVMASGQVVGLIEDLPSAKEVIERIISDADATLSRLEAGEQ